MIIFKKDYESVSKNYKDYMDDELNELMDSAQKLVLRVEQGVQSERSPITLIEKVQINDTVKAVKKLMIDITKDLKKGRDVEVNKVKLGKALIALETSIEHIL